MRSFSNNFDCYLEAILLSETLKCLQIIYSRNETSYLKIRKEIKSSVESLVLRNVWWEFASNLLEVERFPHLKEISIRIKDENLDLGMMFEKLSSFPQLTWLKIEGDFTFSNEQPSFTLKTINSFCLESSQATVDLNRLLRCMPNLIELRLIGQSLSEIILQNPVGIRYLILPYDFFKYGVDFINIVKYTPNLIQLGTVSLYPIHNAPFASEFAYYFKMLKEHFNTDLEFEINPNCLPIKQLENDERLLKLVSFKSPELENYLEFIFPIHTFKSVVMQLFTVEIEKCFNNESIDNELIKFF